MKQREKIISNYIDAYNNFEINRMLLDFDEDIKFENISNGTVNLSIKGLAKFKEQAEQATKIFTKRRQTIKSFDHQENQTKIEITYRAILAVDFPNGMQKGEELNLEGKSVFEFSDGKIISLTDIS